MVDFNNDTLMSRPPNDIVALIILEWFDAYLKALEVFINKEDKAYTHNTLSILKSRLYVMFMAQRPALKRALPQEAFKFLEKLPGFEDYAEIEEAYIILSEWLDKIKLLKLDVLTARDFTDITQTNKASGFD